MDEAASLRKVFHSFGGSVILVDVSARDGLQAQASVLSPDQRVAWIKALLAAGVQELEAGSFVAPGLVPQMAGSSEVLRALADVADALWVLVPNLRGLESAITSRARNVVFLASATEAHSVANLRRSVAEVVDRLPRAVDVAREAQVRVRLAISAAWGDPDDGKNPSRGVLEICERAAAIGISEVTLCDTYGGASPQAVADLLDEVFRVYPREAVGLHLHDLYGTAVAGAFVGLCLGVRRFDASVGGLGGCPVLPDARGNLATESLNHLLRSLGFETGIDEILLQRASRECLQLLRRADGKERLKCQTP